VTALALGAFACALAPPHEHEIAEGWRGAPAVRRALLAPMNGTAPIAEELLPGAERTFAAAKAHLEAHGIAVETVAMFRFQSAWTRSFAGVALDPKRDLGSIPAEAIVNLMTSLRAHHDFDVLVMPAIELRETRLSGYAARWDGVSRKLVDDRTSGTVRWSGSSTAASLRVHIYAENGERIFDSVGGLDMLFKYAGGARMALMDDPLADLDHLREGTRVAFDPFIPFTR
jgi:hypothetical protein